MPCISFHTASASGVRRAKASAKRMACSNVPVELPAISVAGTDGSVSADCGDAPRPTVDAVEGVDGDITANTGSGRGVWMGRSSTRLVVGEMDGRVALSR